VRSMARYQGWDEEFAAWDKTWDNFVGGPSENPP
jgi:hypothetical protein